MFLEGLGPGVRAVYEAGPTGFGLVRAARERGIEVRVVAPGSIPKGRVTGSRPTVVTRSGWRGCWRPASCGSRSCRAWRMSASATWCAASRTSRGDLMRARHRLSKFLLRRGERYPGPGRRWTRQAHALAARAALR